MDWGPDNRFRIVPPKGLPAGRYTALVGVFLDGNTPPSSVKAFGFDIGGNN